MQIVLNDFSLKKYIPVIQHIGQWINFYKERPGWDRSSMYEKTAE